MRNNSGYLARQQALVGQQMKETRHQTRVYTLDMVTIALGRMGFREARFRKFDEALTQASKDYAELIVGDSKEDKELVYSKATLDRELQQYVGTMFVPYEERYR